MTPDRVRGRLWAQRLKRVFHIDIETGSHGGRAVKIIACIEDPAVITTIFRPPECQGLRRGQDVARKPGTAAGRPVPLTRRQPLRSRARRMRQGARMSRAIGGVGRTGLLNRAPFAVRVR